MNKSIDNMEKDRNWSISILNYIRDLSKSRYDLDTYDVYNDAISQINNCYDLGQSMQLSKIKNEITEIASNLDRIYKKDLNKVLKEKFGMDLCDINKKMAERMAKVLERGKIRNDDEFVRVTEWVDHLIQDDPKIDESPDGELSEEIEAYNKLIADYEAKAAAKLARQRKKNEQTT